MASATKPIPPVLLWAHRNSLGKGSFELIDIGSARPNRDWVPVVAVPLTTIGGRVLIESQESEFHQNGIRIHLSVIAGKLPARRKANHVRARPHARG
jgi:hypothetical protein